MGKLNIVEDTRSYNIGTSDYSKHKYQPWDFWLLYGLNPFDGDILKRALRTKLTDPRLVDYQKIRHISLERLRQLQEAPDVFPAPLLPNNSLDEMLKDYDTLVNEDIELLKYLLIPQGENRKEDYNQIIKICDKRILDLNRR